MKAVVLYTFRTLLREKILFNVFGITLLFLFFGYLASQLVFGHQDRVMLNMGLMVNALSIFGVGIGAGARLFRQDIENKTIYLIISRPISRLSFFLARYLGMMIFVALNFSILTFVLILSVKNAGGDVSHAFVQSSILTFLEASILLAGSLTLSFWLRPALVFMAMVALIFLGHNHDMIHSLQANPETQSQIFGFLTKITPNFSLFLMSERVFYSEALPTADFGWALLYGLCWLFFFLLMGNAVFSRKNL